MEALIQALNCQESDQQCFYALSVLLTMTTNPCRYAMFDLFELRQSLRSSRRGQCHSRICWSHC
jgi:hypothetical protein